ncbi:hypothetical protein CAEBREN_08551 [Caenorhabditis brenneri]|uniref:RNA-directed DNA polymerase n=1 Tax=Caenorhabditis brenneri TaxID=135651 RepID=G0NB80_CAEBE|nr:hypothetical protein CAEBREN_08551 [Caenorhabditis brenneri]
MESVYTDDDSEAGWSDKMLGEVQQCFPEIMKIRERFWKRTESLEMRKKYYCIGEIIYRVPNKKTQRPPVLLESCGGAKALVEDIHWGSDHKNAEYVMNELQNIAVWKGMRRDVAEVIENCMKCRTKRKSKRRIFVNSIMTIGGKTHLPFAPIHLDGVPIVALIDSGASVSLIPERVMRQLKLENRIEPTHCSAKVANGSNLAFLGKTKVIVTLGKTSVSHELLITKNRGAPAACLLGIDFINAVNKQGQLLTFNVPEKWIKVGKTTVNLLGPHEYVHNETTTISVVCDNDEVIPPRCQAIIAGSMPGVKSKNRSFIINDTNVETDDMYSISPTLTTMDSEGKVVVKITNPGNAEIVFRKGTRIAEAEIYKEEIQPQVIVNTVGDTVPYSKENADALIKKINLEDSNLSPRAKEQVKKLIREYQEAFVGLDGKIGKFKGVTTHHIELNDNHRIPQARPYRINPEMREKLEKEIKAMKEKDIIEPSTSPYSSPVLMVPKPNGDLRVDYRRHLIVVSNDEDQHVKDLGEFFRLMIKMGLKLKAEKSQIGRIKISYLGFIIENNTITPNTEKTNSIQNFPVPKTVTDVKSFLGMASYFRRFIKDFAIIAKPLTHLTKKEVGFKWGQEQEKAFAEIKNKLISPPVLTTPQMNGDFELHTDASKIGIAAVLLQDQEEELKVIAYASRPTTPVEQKYAPIKLEALAITWGLTHYRPYVFGKKVKVVTDHQPLKSLLHRKEKEMSGRLLRHQAIIQMYDVEIVYRPGKENPVADALSRQRVEQREQIASITEENEKEKHTSLEIMQQNSHSIQKMKHKLKEGKDEKARKLHCKYILIDDVVHGLPDKDGQLPPVLIEGRNKETKSLIMQIHRANSHIGALKMITKMESIAIWNGMKREIEEVVLACEECQLRKNPPAYSHILPLGRWEIPTRPFQRVHIDVMGPLPETIHGNKLIIVATDAFSKFAIAKAVPDQTAETTIKFMIENIVQIHGIPEEIVSDQGRNFISNLFEEVCKLLEMEHSVTTAYHHQTNGAVERLNRTLEEMLTLSTKDPRNFTNWDEKLPLVVQSYNASTHSTTKFAPEYIIFGRVTVSPTDIMVKTARPSYKDEEDLVENLTEAIRQCHSTVYKSLKKSQDETKKTHDERFKVKVPEFQTGDKVLIRNQSAGKLMYQFSRPVTITSTTASTVTVRTAKGKFETVHKNRIKKLKESKEWTNSGDKTTILDDSIARRTTLSGDTLSGEQQPTRRTEGNGRQQWPTSRLRSRTMNEMQHEQHPMPLRRSRRIQNLPAELA